MGSKGVPSLDIAAITEVSLEMRNSTALVFTIAPTRGHHVGQQSARSHTVQFRGIFEVPRAIFIDGKPVKRIQPGCRESGGYISGGSKDGRDALTQPPGTLIVVTG